MATTRYITAANIVKRAGIECGLTPPSDIFASDDPSIVQFRNLLNTCGEDLVESFEWEYLRREHTIVTDSADSGQYDLPDDFGYMINQTGWERTENVPLSGPLTAQQWQYLKGRDLTNSTIYISFRYFEDKFNIYPDDPVPDAQEIFFEYISREWVQTAAGSGSPDSDAVTANGDIVLFKPVMIVQYLRYKFLDAKGFDTTSSLAAFTKAFLQATGGNKGAPVLNAGARLSGVPLLGYRNIPETNYGV